MKAQQVVLRLALVVCVLAGAWLRSAAAQVTIPYSGQWHFDEGSGTVVQDSSGRGSDGSISGAAWTTDSRSGSAALLFNGTDAFVATADIDLPSTKTIWASVKVAGYTGYPQQIISKWNPGFEGNYELGLTQDLRPYFQVGFSGSGNWACSSTPLALGIWYDLVGTYDGSTLRLYVDGQRVAYSAISGQVDQNDLITTIGCTATQGLDTTLSYFNGTIDEVGIASGVHYGGGERGGEPPSAFVGFGLSDSTADAAAEYSQAIKWEFAPDGTSNLGVGLPAGSWHEIRLVYSPVHRQRLLAWLDGVWQGEYQFIYGDGPAARSVLLGVHAADAVGQTYYDDVQVTRYGSPRQSGTHLFAQLEGPERVAATQESVYRITYGNGYPMLGLQEEGTPLSGQMYVAARLPDGYSFVSADPAPARSDDQIVVWAVPRRAPQQAGVIQLRALTAPSFAEGARTEFDCWATEDAGVAAGDPAAGEWGRAQDLLPQRLDPTPIPDVLIRKQGPSQAAPGDAINYVLTVGNIGSGPIESVVVKDRMPEVLGGAEGLAAVLPSLVAGEWWTGTVSGTLPLGLADGTLVFNRAFVPTGVAEADYSNNTSEWVTTIQATAGLGPVWGRIAASRLRALTGAGPRGAVAVFPEGAVSPGQRLTYSLEC
jgi:uncharacterized repeat protein (TIGR01451 family)